jgi:hypothetical protein
MLARFDLSLDCRIGEEKVCVSPRLAELSQHGEQTRSGANCQLIN